MLIDSHNFRRVILAAGKTDLRKGIDGLAALVKSRFDLDPFEPDVLFLFCGTSKRKIKGLLWEGDGSPICDEGRLCGFGHHDGWPEGHSRRVDRRA